MDKDYELYEYFKKCEKCGENFCFRKIFHKQPHQSNKSDESTSVTTSKNPIRYTSATSSYHEFYVHDCENNKLIVMPQTSKKLTSRIR